PPGSPPYAAKIEREELPLDWSQPPAYLHGVVRLGRAWTTFRDKPMGVLRATVADGGPAPGELDGLVVGTGDGGGLALIEVQPEGKGRQSGKDWRNGARPRPGERLGP